MTPDSEVLVIAQDISCQQRIAEEFEKQKLTINICFTVSQEEAIDKMEYNSEKKSFDKFPQLILLDINCPSDKLFESLRLDQRCELLSLYLLIDHPLSEKIKQKLDGNRINGFVDRNFVFNDYSTNNYMDQLDLHIKILKIGLHRKLSCKSTGNL